MHRCRAFAPVRYWKPIQTGIEQDDDRETVRVLGSCAEDELFLEGRPIAAAGVAAPRRPTVR